MSEPHKVIAPDAALNHYRRMQMLEAIAAAAKAFMARGGVEEWLNLREAVEALDKK